MQEQEYESTHMGEIVTAGPGAVRRSGNLSSGHY